MLTQNNSNSGSNNSSDQLRKIFIDYFRQRGHEVVPSGPLVPTNDPTLLFTNSGMVQFKNVFLGIETRPYQRAVSVQRCIRAGGKHNDLENVGYTARHHTFFEMLGNFSFGDYFKYEAIKYAWHFLTKILQLPKERLWITVFRGDPESEAIWLKEMKVDPTRFTRCGEKDNFWQMGDTGPCGPCTEIFYDHGPNIAGGPPGSPDTSSDRYVEIWNLVFMQYRKDLNGKFYPLLKPCVDTGMGLERVSAIMQGAHNDYDIDLFRYLLKVLGKLVGKDGFCNASMCVIVDHIRSAAFLIGDGVVPSNEGRGYVLRRIIRRAVRHGYRLGKQELFFYKLIEPLINIMGDAYPMLPRAQFVIEQIIEQEEIQFSKTLLKGLKILDHELSKLPLHEIPGDVIFQLYDTFGFPPDLTADIARERGFSMDYAGFNKAMKCQRAQSQHMHRRVTVNHMQTNLISSDRTEFVGYETFKAEGHVTTLLQDNKPISTLFESQNGIVILNRTPFYAESGGQVGDQGFLLFEGGHFRVKDTQKKGNVYLHLGEVVKGKLEVKQEVHAQIDDILRLDIMRNHSATHLLHEALRRALGEHVMQKGSLVEAKRLRFDFSHHKSMTKQELHTVEQLINRQIQTNLVSRVKVMTLEKAKEAGALALFNERYEEEVRVLEIGDFSIEICEGTHIKRTGEIGLFKIISESGCASGVRRIEAVTGQVAVTYVESEEEQLRTLSDLLKTSQGNLIKKLKQLLEDYHNGRKELVKLKQQIIHQKLENLLKEVIDIQGIKVLVAQLEIDGINRNLLKSTANKLKQKLGKAAIVLAIRDGKRVQLVAGVTKNCLAYFNAIELLTSITEKIGGSSGGWPDMAQGGGNSPERLKEAFRSVYEWIKTRIE